MVADDGAVVESAGCGHEFLSVGFNGSGCRWSSEVKFSACCTVFLVLFSPLDSQLKRSRAHSAMSM